VLELLSGIEHLEDISVAYADFDWRLHQSLAIASRNPIFSLILNGFSDFYVLWAEKYFSFPSTRRTSLIFYLALRAAAEHNDPEGAALISRQAMQESIDLWRTGSSMKE
jgi:GntR family negative regulator for fad regulon and positive regulator of fabA